MGRRIWKLKGVQQRGKMVCVGSHNWMVLESWAWRLGPPDCGQCSCDSFFGCLPGTDLISTAASPGKVPPTRQLRTGSM